MRQYIGSIVFAVLSVVVPVVGSASKWPWPLWAWVAIGILLLLGAILSFPVRKPLRPSSAFVSGDASGSSFRNVYSDADNFVSGDARQAIFWNIIHLSRPHQR
jgi:hypothetical protein